MLFKVNIYIETDSEEVKRKDRAYAALVEYIKQDGKHEKRTMNDIVSATRNQIMLIALNEALGILLKPCDITVYMDNKYVSENIRQGRMYEWKANGWKTVRNEEIANVEEWRELVKLIKDHNIVFLNAKSYADKEELKKQIKEMMKQREQWEQQRLDGGI